MSSLIVHLHWNLELPKYEQAHINSCKETGLHEQ